MPEDYSPARIDQYIASLFSGQHDMAQFDAALAAMAAAELPSINVSASEGMMLHAIIRAVGAKRVLEIGTLGGYSGLWIASALPSDGRMITLELDPKHADVAASNFERAGYGKQVEVRVGAAIDSLRAIGTSDGNFDVTFIDADKGSYCDYLDEATRLTRAGGLILSDNTLTHQAIDPEADTGITRFNKKLAATSGLISATLPTLREGIDGLTMSVVLRRQ